MSEQPSHAELIAQLKDPKSSRRREAAKRLSSTRETQEAVAALIGALSDSEPSVQEAAIRSLVEIDGETTVAGAIPLLLHELPTVKNAAVEVLEKIGARHLDRIVGLLADDNLDIRKFGADILGTLRDAKAVPALVKALDDTDANVRSSAAEALGKIGDKSAGATLLARLKVENETWVVFHLIETLGQIASPWMVSELVSLASARDEVCREVLMDTVGLVGGTENLADLLAGFSKANSSMSGHLVQAILKIMARLGEDSVLPTLQHRFEEFGSHLRSHLSQKDDSRRINALVLLGKLRRASREELSALLGDPNRDLRILAMKTMDSQGMGLPSAKWIEILEDADPYVRFEAVNHMANELAGEVADALVQKLPHEVELVQIAILRVLGAKKDGRIQDFAKKLAQSEIVSLKDAAEGALRHLATPGRTR